MKSRFILFLSFIVLMAVSLTAQTTVYKYKFTKSFPDTNYKWGNGGHGIAVDPEGKVWIALFGGKDSMLVGGVYKAITNLQCYKPDGTPASFSPIRIITAGGVTDTLFGSSNRGLRADKKGNIVLARATGVHYRINYKTGVGMNRVLVQATSPTAPAFDDANEMFTACVSPAVGPIRIFSESFALLGNVVDSSRAFSRTIEVSGNGNDVYYAGYTANKVTRYTSANGSFGPYSTIDTVMKGLTVEALAWHPKTGYLWAGGGNVTSGINFAPYTDYSYYAFKPTDMTKPVDSIKWSSKDAATLLANDPRPRGIAFSPTGDTMYVTAFNVSVESPVQMFIGKGVPAGVSREDGIVASNYELMQNYPNPFNPSTQIKFTVSANVTASLKVFDVLGKEVSTLVDGEYAAGSYTVDFNAKNLTTGMYFYTLKTSNGFTQTKKMLLIK